MHHFKTPTDRNHLCNVLLLLLLQAEDLIDALTEGVIPHIPSLPLLTQSAIALALAQLSFYNADVYEAIATAVLAAADTSSSSSSSNAATAAADASGSSAGGQGVLSISFADLPAEVLPGVVLSLAAGFSLNAFYQQEVFEVVVQQVRV